ncbi:MAG: NotI family restriction endonuclease [Candidatus Methylacidiphilales bacterium]
MPPILKKIASRHSIGEWYGKDLQKYTPLERQEMALAELKVKDGTGKGCPFRGLKECKKKGGVCSLRSYRSLDEGALGFDSPIAICPNRLLEGGLIYQWVGEVLLGSSEPVVLSEIGFLDRLKRVQPSDLDVEDPEDVIGRIDNVLLHPERKPIDWCALELQAVYFSGQAMSNEFKLLSSWTAHNPPFPASQRRPDWRSSGPKRLLPQLQTKTPTIRTWGKKIAVVIDEPFFNSLIGLDPANEERYLSNAEVVWFIVGYDPCPINGWKLAKRRFVQTKLETSVRALTGGVPLSKEVFEEKLIAKLKKNNPHHGLLK